MTFEWESDPEQVMGTLAQDYSRAIHVGIFAIAQSYAPEIENWMRANAPWTDRTGNARQSLWSDVNEVANMTVELIMSHGVDYGKWLELLHSGRYAIITPALDHFAPKIWADVKRMLS